MPAPSPDACRAPHLIERALHELARGELGAAPAWIRRAKMLSDAEGEPDDAALSRYALAVEEAVRGDFVAAERYAEEGLRCGAGSAASGLLAIAVRAFIDAHRAHSLLLRGERARAADAWQEASSAARVLETTILPSLGTGAQSLVELASRTVRELDPRGAWLVGPKATWIEAPDGTRVDLSTSLLLRRIWQVLAAHHAKAPSAAVSPRQLCMALWPDMDPGSPIVRNRMKVAMWRMRELGLRSAVEQAGRGYRLASTARFVAWQPSTYDEAVR